MARTCFPSENLNGNNGHTPADVTCEFNDCLFNTLVLIMQCIDIFFTGDKSVLPGSAIGNNYVTNFSALKTLGDQLMTDLVGNLKL